MADDNVGGVTKLGETQRIIGLLRGVFEK